MVTPDRLHRILLTAGAGLFGGFLFTWIVGDLNAAHYLIELMSIGPLEIPFVILVAVIVRKYGWHVGLVYSLLGTAVSLLMFSPEISATPVIFCKTAATGLIIGETKWFSRSFAMRLSAVSFPGFVLAFVFGLPLILHGVSPVTMDEIRQDALEMYQAFMSKDNALNAVENAMVMFKFFFRTGLGVFFLGSLILSWLSFIFSRWIMVKLKVEAEYVPPMYTFTIPFHAIWFFLAGLGIYLIEYKPLLPITINVLFIMAGLYGIQGLAIVMYYMERISIGLLPRVLFWLVFFVTITFSIIILIITGIIDSWINLRSYPLTAQPDGQEEGNKHESDS